MQKVFSRSIKNVWEINVLFLAQWVPAAAVYNSKFKTNILKISDCVMLSYFHQKWHGISILPPTKEQYY
jgi:hypothetical protein